MRTTSMTLRDYLAESAAVLHRAAEAIGQDVMDAAIGAVVEALSHGKPLLVCGNGGSASDAQHITGELVGRFLEERRALKAICLSSNPAVITAWSNDHGYDSVFARQVEAYGEKGAVLLGISTSGNSKSVVAAFAQARQVGMITIALTVEGGGKLAPLADHLLAAPSSSTPMVQQIHVCLYHYLCRQIERRMMEVHRAAGV
jgi:D-sedoheptulose 7-phosphate isomerase